MVSVGSSGSSSELQTATLPGIFGAEDPNKPRELGLSIESLLGQDVGFGGRTLSENQLLSELMDITGSRTAVRGLGAPTAESLASSIAPALLDFRQQRVANQGQRAGLLLELLGLAAPQVVAGQRGTARESGFNIFGTSGQNKATVG